MARTRTLVFNADKILFFGAPTYADTTNAAKVESFKPGTDSKNQGSNSVALSDEIPGKTNYTREYHTPGANKPK